MKVDPIVIIQKYYDSSSRAYHILIEHSEAVAEKAVEICNRVPDLEPDRDFVYQAAMLHDIAIYKTHAPGIDCFGDVPYIQHGILGRDILEQEGLPAHAMVCERHIGVGISASEIVAEALPLPVRDMLPETLEEEIVCFADKFFSKTPDKLRKPKKLSKIAKSFARRGNAQLYRLTMMAKKFREPGLEEIV